MNFSQSHLLGFTKLGLAVAAALLASGSKSLAAPAQPAVVIAVSAAGEADYQEAFKQWVEPWQSLPPQAAPPAKVIGLEGDGNADLKKLRETLQAEAPESTEPIWLILLGHGTFGGGEPKFNLRGDDLTAAELANWLQPFKRPVIVVAGFSASGAFLKPIAGPGRIIITATKSGAEQNYARFGRYFSKAVTAADADLDKDGQTSLLEAWLSAARQTAEFYKGEGRLITEHTLLDDNGDGFGTPSDWFKGTRVVKKSKDNRASDGLRAHQIHLLPSEQERKLSPMARAERDRLELELSQLRDNKPPLPDADYWGKLEAILLKIARLYHQDKPAD